MATIWQLDFYSRPVLDENQKRIWELLICDGDRELEWVKICPPDRVNSSWLSEELANVLEVSGQVPQKVRYFRPSMGNIIQRGCKQAGLNPLASRRLFALSQWLQERMDTVYPQQPGFQAPDSQPLPLHAIGQIPAKPVPDALMAERWACVSLPASDLAAASEWSMDFGELFPVILSPEAIVPGLIVYSHRAAPLAAWMSGVDPVFLKFERNFGGDRVELVLEASGEARWSWSKLQLPRDAAAIAQGDTFEASKNQTGGVHFLAIQSDPNVEHFAGFWLLKEV